MLHGLLSVETRVGCWLFRFPAVCALDRGREFEGFGVTDEAAARLEDRCGEVLASTCGRRGDRYDPAAVVCELDRAGKSGCLGCPLSGGAVAGFLPIPDGPVSCVPGRSLL